MVVGKQLYVDALTVSSHIFIAENLKEIYDKADLKVFEGFNRSGGRERLEVKG